MTAYLIVSYDISDPERYAEYNPGSLKAIGATIAKYEGSAVAGGPVTADVGEVPGTCVVISFPDAEAARAWMADEEYAPLRAIRYESTTNISEVIVKGR